MSFCRITGRSRGLPKPNYFPLLPPISPADAKRFCRITGKSYGLPTHHYIPVLLGVHTNDKSKCRITNVSDTLGQHHYTGGLILGERKKHVILKDYRYVFPVLKDDDEQQKVLRDLLSAKETRDEEKSLKFVYTVDERRCSLVFPAKLEAAVRDGDVRDVMLSRDCDTVLLRLKQGKNVSVDFRNLDVFEDLYDGLGPRQDVLKEREKLEHEAKKRKRKRAAGLSYAKKIFEDKEKVADEEELRKTKQLKLRSIREETRLKDEEKFVRWKHIDLENARSRATQLTTTSESRETIAKHLTTSCDWREIDGKAEKFDGMPLIDKIPTPVQAEPEIIDLEATEMGAVISPISTETGGLEAISVVKPFVPLNVVPDAGLQHALETIPSHELEETADVTSKFLAVGKQALEVLPRIEEIPELVKNVGDGKKHTMHNVKGLKIDVESAQRFVTGQTVETPSGPIFVPGQTLKTPKGNAFVPGFTVHTPDGPLLIPGQIVTVAEKSGEKTPVFVAGQTLPTKCGQRFVQGQTIHTSEGARFVTGQTVLTEEGPKFVAGQIVTENNFVPGQTVLTPTGARFMPGQTVTDQHGEHVFMPGQSVEQNGTWTFIAGQCLASSTGESMFVPGRTLVTPEGPRFVAGQDVISNTGQSHFVPGIAVDSNGGLKFVPGTTLETPQGPKFVEGQMMKTPDGVRFVPGSTTSIKSSGTFEFAAANSMNDLVFMEATPTGIPVDPKTASAIPLLQQQEVYGHMVQTDDGVEFIPEWTQKYPEGKRIVPGQLVRGGKDSPRFVPGVMTEEGFLPGQIVMTEKGEQFVPGQVVDTSTGPKFVPGRMVETRSGSKFVPGQTVETEDGPRFVPGQIVQTKVGPTFIPGQVISMEDEGSRFVPGQVVDTPEGPRFVPGRVVESGKHGVTFVPGQIVQTEEGPRFVAPDLTDTPEGEMEFSVQGFEVTPEELGLLRPQHLQYNARSHIHQGETSIDARMLRQLSEAGMSVGRKVPANLPNVDVDVDPTAVALEHALVIAEQLGLRGNSAIQMAQVTSTISQLANNIVKQQQLQQSTTMVTNGKQSSAWLVANGNKENGSGDSGVNWLTEAVKASIAAAVLAITDSSDEESLKNGEPTDQSYVLSSISEAFNVVLRRGSTSIDQSVSEVLKILLVSDNRTTLCQEAMLDLLESSSNKIDILKSTVVGQTLKDDIVMERLSAVLDEEVGSDLVGSAFRNVSRGDPELVSRVLQRISQEVGGVATEKEAAETLHKAIVHAVGESSELRVKELLSDEGSQVRELLLQAVGLARALGMSSTASSLLAVISDDESTQVLAGDKLTLDILKRLTVMRKLAEERPQFVSALRDLCSDPELARTDPRLRTLVRESAALMIVPEEIPLKSSVDVPSSLLRAENSLAMEEFLMRRRHGPSKIFMILKQGIQAVVPREASRAVLTGQVAYTVLDENGITYFEPLHVFSALRLNKPAAHRFSMYACPVAGDEDYFDAEMTSTLTIGSVSGTSTNSPDGSCNGNFSGFQQHYRQHQECATNGGVTLTRSDRTEEISSSPENTPSFRKLSSLYADSCYDRKSVENFIVIKDYVAEDDEGFSVNVGDIVEAVDYLHDSTKKLKMDADLEVGHIGERLDNSAAKHKLSIRPRRKYVDPRSRLITRSNSDSDIHRALVRKIDGREGWLPVSILMQTALSEDSSTLTSHHRPEDSQYRREAVVKELVETEEEFGRDIQQVVERYLKPLDTPGVPRTVRDNKEIIFTNLKQIADFHNTSFGRVLIEGVKYYADQPRMLGKTFLRLERDFDKHVAYCRDEPAAQELLQTNEQVREYFEELSQTLGDDKSVSEHLKLPIQRINDYQLLLKELVKYSTRLGENCDDLQKALELMLGIPHRATDNKFISNIEGYKGNIHKLGRLLTHEWFTFIEKDGKSKERYLFLFKARILVCKVRRISDDRSVFVLKDIIKLPEVEVKDHPEDLCTFELHSPSGASGYPLTLVAHKDPVKKYWLKEIREYASDQVALAEHAADDLQLSEVPETGEDQKDRVRPEGARIEPPKLKPEELKTKTEPSKSLAAKPEATKAVAKPEVPKEPEAVKAAPKQEAAVPAPKPETVKQPEVVKPTAGPEAPKITEVPETKAPEKRRDSKTKTEDTASKKIKTEEEMSGQFSASSRFSASTRVVEEYSSVSSSRNAVSSYVESSVSTAAEKTSSSSYASAGKVTETSSSYESAVSGSSMSADTKVEKLALSATETGRPVFVKTIEGSTAEPMRAKKGVIHIIAGENASFECTMASGTDTTKMQWFKDNKPLSDKLADRVVISSTENTFKLTIKHVLEADSGIYTARAANGDGKASCTAQLVVQNLTPEEKKARAEANAPIFLVSLKDTELLENTYLRFMIKVKGDPNPELKFFKDDVPIDSKNERVKIVTEKSESGFYEVVISDVQKQDAGKYSCKAKNRFGEASSEATVSVTDEKTIFAGLPEGFLEAGTEPNFKWLRDGKPFDPEERFKVLFEDKEDTLALVFQHVKPEDAGLYTCVAQTNTGNISCSAELTVQGSVNQLLKDPAKPALGTESKQSEVSAGGSAMLDLQVKGYPKPDITWTKDGQEIVAGGRIKYLWEDEESLSLVIKNVTVQDAGTYVIRAKNELGEDTTQIELIVKSAPKFVKKMSDFSSYIEQDVSMSVQIAASPAPDVKWYKDGQLLQDSDRITIKKETNDTYTLNIREARLDDAGSYSVVAKNEISQTSEFWKFDVKCPPKITKKLGESRIVNEGETLNLQIEVETFPEPTVVWLKDEEIIVETERIKITSDGGKHALKITGTVSTDAATYKAVVTNKDGKTVDQTGIEVRSAPRFKTQLSDVTAKEGDVDVALEVEVGGFPRPSVQWYIGDVEITETRKEFTRVEEGDNYKLIIKEVKTELSGKYTCKLKNEYGVNSSSSNLTVNCRPKIVKKLVDVKCKEGETLKLKVEISGTPDPEIKWFKDGEVLEVSADARIKITRDKQRKESYDLTLNLLKGSDGGVYEVKAENEMGSISCKSKVIVLTAPAIVSSDFADCTIYETQSATFTIKASGLPRPDAKWFKDGKPLRAADKAKAAYAGDTHTLTLNKAMETDTALYQLVLTNKLGEKSIDAFIEVGPESDLRKANFTTPLADINVEKDGTGVFTAVLTADPVPDVVWSLNGKEISPEDERIRMDLQHKTVTDRLEECTITLTIPNCGVEDIGKCSVKASNKWGEASCSADLDLLIQPEILEFKDINAAVEEPAKWEVTIKSNPKANLTWEKDGQVLDDETRFGAEEDYKNMKYRLVMKQVQYEDAGRYKVTATNYLGEDTAQAELIPYTEPPTFVQGLVDGAVRCDLGIEFKIEAAGIARPKVKWYLNGDEIVNDSRHTIETRTEEHVFSTLKIRNFEASDEGELSCVATNLAGKCTSRCNASMIRLSPTFESKLPRSAQIDEGQPLELTAQVDGSPYPTVAWYKDGEKIVPDEHVKIEKLPNGLTKLTIDKVLPTDSGAYKLVAKNSNGENSALCAVAVKPLPRKPSFEKPLEDVHVVVGEPLKLEAQVVAFPSPELQWFKDGLPIRPSKEIEFINEPNGLMGLSIDEARASDSGTYALVASNKHGEITGTANVEVEEKEKQPGFLATLHPVKSVEGFAAKLEIKTVGKPKPTLKWTHNGEEIIPDGKHLKIIDQPDGTQALLIEKVRPEDGGDYEVVAENSQGAISSKGSLEVIPKGPREGPEQKPSFLSPMRDVSVEEGDALIFSVPFAGNPIPEVSWTKDGKPLECSDRAIITCDGSKIGLEIYPSEISDGGTYGCELKSPLGDDRTSAHAIVRKVYQKPHFTQTFTDLQQVADFDAKFMARVSGVPMPDIAWYFNDKPIIRDTDKYKIKRDGDACCLYIRNCASADTGRYKCKAVNKDGEAECQARLIVVDEIDRKQKVEPPSFLKKIGDCEVYKGMTAKFTACVTGNPEPAFEWYRNDERVWPTDRIKMEEEGSGLLRLIIQNVEEHDVGKYSLRIYNPHGEETCHAEIRYETLEPRTKKPLADQYQDYDKYRKSGIPLPLADRPIISRMMDRHLTLSWRPSIPIGPRVPVTYLVEMCELPDGDWFTARTGIRSCVCDIRNLEPFRDYKFRIRVENKYGISDPSPFAQTYRAKLEPDPPKFHPYLPPGIDFRPETSPYFPKDFDIERPPHDGYAQVPRFLRQEFDTQYGVKNHNCNLFWFVYGYPKPKMTYYFNNELIESGGGRYDQTYTRNGQATLFINKMLERDVGMYEAVATNEHGQARQRVRLQIAEYPTFVQRPEETVIMMRRNGQIQARIIGIPYPEIKWYKDWKPITETSRIKIVSLEPDISILILNDVIAKDTGLYSISARNVAGSVSSSAMIHIEDNEHDYGYRTYTRLIDVKPRAKPLDDFYDLGDELGRGTQGITYHAVERTTGNTFAAKVMHGKGEVRPFMYNEMSAMNHLSHRKLLRLHDAFETDGSLTLVMELAGGGELVDNLTKQSYYTEYEIAGYIRQVLQGLHYIHDNNWAHLGLTLGDLLISHPGGDDLKIGDFGLARRIAFGRLMTLVYGMPEYVAPEVANGEGVSYGADMWSLGIITYILLSGVSPFRGINDRETLTKIKEGHWEFEESWWCNISEDARDFITRLLCYTAEGRLDVVRALRHPWLNLADKPHADAYKIPSENLKNYYKLYRDWYSNASCRTWYRRRRLSGAFEHPSKMVYPPGQKYTPEPSPERSYSPSKKPTTRTWENRVPSREPIDTEIGMFSNESHYQNGPDTYLLQLRDTDFPVRLREYMKVANNRGAGFARTICDDNSYDWRTPIIRERRRFTDVMDEEIDDERKARINNYGANDCHTLRRLRHELGTRLDSYAEAEAMMETKKGGNLPFFREKPQILPIEGGKCAQLCCLAVGNPRPAIQWFKNDLVIQEGNRIRIIEDTEGRSMLSFNPAREHDVGIYKVVARNKVGQTVARTRVVLATVPGIPNAPEVGGVSDTEVLLRWKPPKDDGNSEVLCYNLQYKAGDAIEWIDAASNIDHEFFLVRDLVPETSYNFRLAARNRIGWSEKGLLTNLVQTKPAGTAKLQITRAMRHLQALTESGQEIVLEEDKPHIDYSVEDQPLDWTIDTHFTERYSFISEVCKGQFSRVVKGSEKLTDKMVVAKLLDVRQQLQEQVGREFQALRSLRHERIAILEAAYWAADSPVAVLILEKLQGADVLTYLASRHEYTENCVATIITQVLDGLQYLHWRGYCHLNIQPDNVVMASLRSAHVKIVDMGEARKVSKLGTEIPKVGHPEYRSPEVENEELCYPQTDIWSVAVLGYVLMSGASPFRGGDHNETRQNISFVRYRFEYLFKEISQEATRFLMLLFKRTPSKRPTAEECHEHRWLLPTEFMIRKRERAIFPGSRLKNYNEEYHQEKNKLASSNDSLAEAFGAIRQLNRSNSIQDELITSYEVEE
ncbi:obscurin isoform X7 [Venturia canescens]|uniref:obscurin isoform X7 n=1 Tax=Venturia canescens TaxID=32260 RepID=UPI001C9C888D|nr:obscurin isoform X7 [Venturia canescens]